MCRCVRQCQCHCGMTGDGDKFQAAEEQMVTVLRFIRISLVKIWNNSYETDRLLFLSIFLTAFEDTVIANNI